MNEYRYDGPVYIFDKYVGEWKGQTMAVSEAKAKSNLEYQCKTQMGYGPGAAVRLSKDYIS